MVQGRGCMGDATSLLNQAPIVSYVLLKIYGTSHCRGGTRFLCNLQILNFSLRLLPPISQVVGTKHLSWSFGCLKAAQNAKHLCNPTKVQYVWYDFQLLCVIHLTVLQSLAKLYDDSIQLWLSLCYQLQKVDQNVSHFSVRNLQSEIC